MSHAIFDLKYIQVSYFPSIILFFPFLEEFKNPVSEM